MAKLWKARETSVRIADAVTVTTTQALSAFLTSSDDVQANVKNVTVAEPEGAVDIQNFLGETATDFQNAELDEKPFGLATISGTMILPAGEVLINPWASGTGATPSGYKRYQMGSSTATTAIRKDCAILVTLADGTYEVNILLNNAKITKLGDKRIAGPDGHWEQDFNAVCLPKDYYVEFKD